MTKPNIETKTASDNAPKVYVLTDGIEQFAQRLMTKQELAEAQDKADIASAGNVFWTTPRPLRFPNYNAAI